MVVSLYSYIFNLLFINTILLKYKSLSNEFTLQKLVNRSMDLYLIDDEFKQQIHDWKNLKPSGSRL